VIGLRVRQALLAKLEQEQAGIVTLGRKKLRAKDVRGRSRRAEVASCQHCGEPRLPGPSGKLPPHRCAA
jgi:hypothetical protein